MISFRRQAAYTALIGLAVGIFYGMNNIANATSSIFAKEYGLLELVSMAALSPTAYGVTIGNFFNMIPLFILIMFLGGIMPRELRISAPYRFTREAGRVRWYYANALKLTVLACEYWATHAAAYGAVFAISGELKFSLNDMTAVVTALFLHLLPCSIALLLWTNWLESKLNHSSACVCVIGISTILILALPNAMQFNWLSAINPMLNVSALWAEWFAMSGAPFGFNEFSALYWLIVICATLAYQQRYFSLTDVI